jgi:hypothetical protein
MRKINPKPNAQIVKKPNMNHPFDAPDLRRMTTIAPPH